MKTIHTVLDNLRARDKKVSWVHLRWINPLPENLAGIIANFEKVLVPEINMGQLIKIIRSEYLVDAIPYNKVRVLPFNSGDLSETILEILKD